MTLAPSWQAPSEDTKWLRVSAPHPLQGKHPQWAATPRWHTAGTLSHIGTAQDTLLRWCCEWESFPLGQTLDRGLYAWTWDSETVAVTWKKCHEVNQQNTFHKSSLNKLSQTWSIIHSRPSTKDPSLVLYIGAYCMHIIHCTRCSVVCIM